MQGHIYQLVDIISGETVRSQWMNEDAISFCNDVLNGTDYYWLRFFPHAALAAEVMQAGVLDERGYTATTGLQITRKVIARN